MNNDNGEMRRLLDFFTDLSSNNNKPWFDAHKSEYLKVKEYFEGIVAQLLEGIGEFDPSIRGLDMKQCTYRIYRDIRFSKDKTPYKNHIGTYICPFGKCSGYSGYYFHIQPVALDTQFDTTTHMLCTGIYWAPPEVIKSIREDIDGNGANFDAAVREARGFSLSSWSQMKRVPHPYPQDHPYAEYLKFRAWTVEKDVDESYIMSKDLVKNVVADFRTTYHFNRTLNMAIAYAYDKEWLF
jgi:uncharacterized protein (TIGR02453 family)